MVETQEDCGRDGWQGACTSGICRQREHSLPLPIDTLLLFCGRRRGDHVDDDDEGYSDGIHDDDDDDDDDDGVCSDGDVSCY